MIEYGSKVIKWILTIGIDAPTSTESGYFGIWNWTVYKTKPIGQETQFRAVGSWMSLSIIMQQSGHKSWLWQWPRLWQWKWLCQFIFILLLYFYTSLYFSFFSFLALLIKVLFLLLLLPLFQSISWSMLIIFVLSY